MDWQCEHLEPGSGLPIIKSGVIPCAECRSDLRMGAAKAKVMTIAKSIGDLVNGADEADRIGHYLTKRGWTAHDNEPVEKEENEVMDNVKKNIVGPKVLQVDIGELGHDLRQESTEEQEAKAEALHQRLGSFTSSGANRNVVRETNPGDEVVRPDNFIEPHEERDAFSGVLERTPYGIRNADGVQPTLRVGPNYMPAGDSGIVEPLNFNAPQPGPVRKSAPVRKFKGLGGGLFANVIKQGRCEENGK